MYSIQHALRQLRISHKKTLRYAERDLEQHLAYGRTLRQIIRELGAQSLVYLDCRVTFARSWPNFQENNE